MNKISLMNTILNFSFKVFSQNPKSENMRYINDMIVNSSLYFYEHVDDIVEKCSKKRIVIVDGLNVSHNKKYIERHIDMIDESHRPVIDKLLSDKATDSDYRYFSEIILPSMLCSIDDTFYYVIVISRNRTTEYYTPIEHGGCYTLCNIDCYSESMSKCSTVYKNDESDDYLIMLLYSYFYKINKVRGVMSLDNYVWYGDKFFKIYIQHEDFKFTQVKPKK